MKTYLLFSFFILIMVTFFFVGYCCGYLSSLSRYKNKHFGGYLKIITDPDSKESYFFLELTDESIADKNEVVLSIHDIRTKNK